jgi:signal transduction histidine kinase
MGIDDLRSVSLFAGLSEDQVSELVAVSTEVLIEPNRDLFHEGEPADFWWVLIDGTVDLLRRVGHEETVVARMDQPGRWAGGFAAWDEHGTYLATARGRDPGHLLRVPAEELRRLAEAWFPFGAQLIRGLYRTARSIESAARQRDSLITLGTLAAGLAHELNNPAAAAIRSVAALEAACDTLASSPEALARSELAPEQLLALQALRVELSPPEADLDPLTRADRDEALTFWLRDHGVARSWVLAPTLGAAGVDVDWCTRLAEVIPRSALGSALDWVASGHAAKTLLGEIKESTRRIFDLVAAVKSYSQMDRAALQRVHVTEGLDSTVAMLGAKLSDIEVVRDYAADVPPIDAYAGELNQVWTNLVVNAADAMSGVGLLRLTTRLEEDSRVVVEVVDSGHGMPPEVAARAFDAFFTTKEVGQGTGLGLDISRRIVEERHGGTISINSRPGETTVRVVLPLRPK